MAKKKKRDITLLKEGLIISTLIFTGSSFLKFILNVSRILSGVDNNKLKGILNSASVLYNNPVPSIVLDFFIGISLFFAVFFLGLFIIYWLLT